MHHHFTLNDVNVLRFYSDLFQSRRDQCQMKCLRYLKKSFFYIKKVIKNELKKIRKIENLLKSFFIHS
jgi:hypothetical protein